MQLNAAKDILTGRINAAILNDIVNAVYVHTSYKSKGYREQQMDMHNNLAGIRPEPLSNDLQNGETA